MHPTHELIKALQNDDIPQSLGELLLLNHLATVCDHCQAKLLAVRQRATDAFVNRLAEIWSLSDTPADEHAEALRDLDELLEIRSHPERLRRIERAYARFRSPLLVALALAEVRSSVAADPGAAFRYAEIACTVARDGKTPRSCLPLALAYAGNARRAAGELTAAKSYFARAYDVLESSRETPHPWLVAEMASLEGSLLKDARLLELGERCLLFAQDHFAAAGDPAGTARAQIKLAAVHRLAGTPDRALEVIQTALGNIRGATHPKLLVTALHSFVMFSSEAGELDRAQTLLDHLAPVYAWYPEFEERHLWLRGIITREAEEFCEAERYYRQALQGFVTKCLPFFAAFVALDLSELLVVTGRRVEVTEVTEPLPRLFRAQGVHREATAAVVLFHKAAAQQAVTIQFVSRLRSFLERSQNDRSLRFILR